MSSPENGTEFPRNRQPTMRTVAMPADTNPYGQIFGGWIMAQMDLAGSVLAIEYAQGRVATVAVHSMEFHQPVTVGDLVSSFARIERIGTTSITVRVEVFAQRPALCVKVTEAVIVYVAVDGEGQRRPLPEHEPAFQSVYG
ncbi:acyl-CoA thioesterase [Plasticicumulans sp.]|uniref:acyl-CoA thioesterase n=1 Tax=Plasticicumulans sp. TaxID=2307179 RepID=UPI000FB55E12|nr:acyl-CoA thioesterase [Plasticicumulans sp.]MBS0600873.1 acyl-CoA thioesterase [Pseudomonadota bacterium]RTL01939.1 MAG: acyl-CoA thioesterase [Xanthomonadales bacterium]HMV38160.1 acyl-CoA thioesterase [Plasticicumulans sp.]HMW30045.1 acyl-CoA thioesterase [Plasticicumulans sp.]HMW41896.1 acyl-CoA thioesterase [Plasticicumulans sp.]